MCPGATDRCHSHKCCTPKTRADFSSDLQCGKKSDGCGGWIHLSQAPATAFFKAKQTRTNENRWNGQRGIEIVAASDIQVTSLARGLMENLYNRKVHTDGSPWTLSESARVSLWDVASKTELGKVDVGPSSPVKDGYAWEDLPSAASLTKGKKYRIVMSIRKGQRDKYTSARLSEPTFSNSFHNKLASNNGLVCASNAEGYPVDVVWWKCYQHAKQGVGMVSFKALENEGCGSGLWTCHANHTCTKKEVTATAGKAFH
jgi:hypothetical protein